MAQNTNVRYHQFQPPRIVNMLTFIAATTTQRMASHAPPRRQSTQRAVAAVQRERNTVDLTNDDETPPSSAPNVIDLSAMPDTPPPCAPMTTPRASGSIQHGPVCAVPSPYDALTPPEAEGLRWWRLSRYILYWVAAHSAYTTHSLHWKMWLGRNGKQQSRCTANASTRQQPDSVPARTAGSGALSANICCTNVIWIHHDDADKVCARGVESKAESCLSWLWLYNNCLYAKWAWYWILTHYRAFENVNTLRCQQCWTIYC